MLHVVFHNLGSFEFWFENFDKYVFKDWLELFIRFSYE